jgi:aspartate carbamoyltransferase catalytic subunit
LFNLSSSIKKVKKKGPFVSLRRPVRLSGPEAAIEKDLLSLDSLSLAEVETLFARCRSLPSVSNSVLESRQRLYWASLFLEPSTRTRISFDMAVHEAGAQLISLDPERSSLKKNETLIDTFLNLEAMGVHGLIVRTTDQDSFFSAASKTSMRILNAGSGATEHPTQALLDAYTLTERFGSVSQLKIGYIGDVAHSRVARSGRALLSRMGAEVIVAGPSGFISEDWSSAQREVSELYSSCDAVILLRAQTERHGAQVADMSNYLNEFGLSEKRVKDLKPGAVVLHPGPCNRGVEIESSVLDMDRCLMMRQVKNGVKIRTALISMYSEPYRSQKS